MQLPNVVQKPASKLVRGVYEITYIIRKLTQTKSIMKKRHTDVVWFNDHYIVKIHYSIKIITAI